MKTSARKTWKNHLGNQSIDPLRLCTPETLGDVVALVQEAERSGCTVRAVGSGHSWSDVALTPGFLLDTSRLSRPLDLEPPRLVYLLLFSHPTAPERLAVGRAWRAANPSFGM